MDRCSDHPPSWTTESANRHIAHLVGAAPAEGTSSVLEEELDDLISDRKEDEALRTILASLSTRPGAVFLVAFLVRILTSHFRYSARMASHYESRAYVLSRGDGGDESLKQLLLPDDIHFEKMPRVPSSDIRDIVTKTVDALKTKG